MILRKEHYFSDGLLSNAIDRNIYTQTETEEVKKKINLTMKEDMPKKTPRSLHTHHRMPYPLMILLTSDSFHFLLHMLSHLPFYQL